MSNAPRSNWEPSSWRELPALQLPGYPDSAALERVERILAVAKPVAEPEDSARLRAAIAKAAAGEAFVLQGGDCAESFADDVAETVAGVSQLFADMTAILRERIAVPVVRIARIAGQFAKPRTAETERRAGVVLPAYRGDIVNGAEFEVLARTPDPERMLTAHRQSLETARLLARRTANEPIHSSHEALLLPYEQALTRRIGAAWWATSAHMLWLGDRTRQIGGAHVEYLRGIENVVGIKCGPAMDPDGLLALAERLEPANRAGRLVLIGRFGASLIGTKLPPLMRAARSAGLKVHWMIDPMHGNTERAGGRKVRRADAIMSETADFFAIAKAEGVQPGGIHLEMTHADVTECLGGRGPASIAEMGRNYRTVCDPRLNRDQAIDLARAVAEMASAMPNAAVAG